MEEDGHCCLLQGERLTCVAHACYLFNSSSHMKMCCVKKQREWHYVPFACSSVPSLKNSSISTCEWPISAGGVRETPLPLSGVW